MGKYFKEIGLLRREFQPIFEEIEYAAFVESNDVINIRTPRRYQEGNWSLYRTF